MIGRCFKNFHNALTYWTYVLKYDKKNILKAAVIIYIKKKTMKITLRVDSTVVCFSLQASEKRNWAF